MKNLLLPLFCLQFFILPAQGFWTENFGTGCNQGAFASGYTGTNGSWTLTATGTNDTYANQWFVSNMEPFFGPGTCSMSSCSSVDNPSLHIGNTNIPSLLLNGDLGCTYMAGGFCSSSPPVCVVTNTRVESPLINCTGKSNVYLSFAYLENGDGATDDGSVWYNDGTTWSLLSNTAKTPACGGSGTGWGIWTWVSIPLPASASNNSNVKIGFNWTNNDDGVGTDPSYAISNMVLSEGGLTGISALSQTEQIVVGSENGNLIVFAQGAYKVKSVVDMLGRSISFSVSGNIIVMDVPLGIYLVQVETKDGVFQKKVLAGK